LQIHSSLLGSGVAALGGPLAETFTAPHLSKLDSSQAEYALWSSFQSL